MASYRCVQDVHGDQEIQTEILATAVSEMKISSVHSNISLALGHLSWAAGVLVEHISLKNVKSMVLYKSLILYWYSERLS